MTRSTARAFRLDPMDPRVRKVTPYETEHAKALRAARRRRRLLDKRYDGGPFCAGQTGRGE